MNTNKLEFDILRTFVESAPVLFLAADKEFKTLYINSFYKKVHNVSQEEAVGKHIKDIIGEEGFNDNVHYYQRTLSGETIKHDSSFTKRDGAKHYYRAIYSPIIHQNKIVGLTGVVLDITSEKLIEKSFSEQRRLNDELKRAHLELEHLASSDPLTRLYNRRYFNEVSSRIFKFIKHKDTPLSILMIDIDHFKSVNDTYGHKTGDNVIVHVANILRKEHREVDTLCRFGGEEFIILLPELNINQAQKIAQRLRKRIENSTVTTSNGKTLNITISVGVSCASPTLDKSIECTIARADDAMYEAKRGGRNQVCIASCSHVKN